LSLIEKKDYTSTNNKTLSLSLLKPNLSLHNYIITLEAITNMKAEVKVPNI